MYWPVETTGMDITQTLWDFIQVILEAYLNTVILISLQKTVVPRGGDTAAILYNVSRGWVMHDEVSSPSLA